MKNNIAQINIPNNWKLVNLGEIFEFKNGVNSEGANFGSGIRFINIMEIINNDFIKANDIPGRISLSQKNIDNNLVKRGDVLFNRTSETPEEVGMTSVYLDDEPVVFGGFVIRGRDKNKNLYNNYKKYCFSSEQVRREIVRRCQGAVRGNIGQKDLEKVPFIFPSISEQKKIALVLETCDQVVEKLSKKIKVRKNIRKGLMQNLLTGKKRLPGFSDKWKELKVQEILQERKEYDYQKNGFELFSLTIQDGVCRKTDRYNREFLVVGDSKKYKKTYFKDIVYNPANLRFGAIAYNLNKDPVLLSPIYKTLKIKNSKIYNADFVAKLLTSNWQINLISSRYSEGTLVERMEVKIDDFLFHKIKLPGIKEQEAIAKILTTSDEEIRLLENKLLTIKDQKKYLLNNLVTGKIRIKA